MSDTPETAAWRPLDNLADVGLHHLQVWATTATQQAHRVLDPDQATIARTNDGYLLTLALRQVLRAAHMIVTGLNGAAGADIAQQALDQFEQQIPDAKNARDVLDHFDDYAQGVGDLSHPGVKRNRRMPTDEAARQFAVTYEHSDDDGHFVLRFGTLAIDVADARDATVQLLADMHTALGLVEADETEILAQFTPHTHENPAFVAFSFYSFIVTDNALTTEDIALLRKLVTPESQSAWGDFSAARTSILGHSFTSRVEPLAPGWVYAKLPPEMPDTRVATREHPLFGAQFLFLQHRPDLGGVWRVHCLAHDLPSTAEIDAANAATGQNPESSTVPPK